MEHLDVPQVSVGGEFPSSRDLFSAAFDTNDGAGGAHALGEKSETSLGAAADLDDPVPLTNVDPVEEPS